VHYLSKVTITLHESTQEFVLFVAIISENSGLSIISV